MIKVGLREANLYFSKYMKMVKEGKEVIVTDRGAPLAVIKPLSKETGSPEDKIKLLEDQGILRRAAKGKLHVHKPIIIGGKPVSEVITEERENRF